MAFCGPVCCAATEDKDAAPLIRAEDPAAEAPENQLEGVDRFPARIEKPKNEEPKKAESQEAKEEQASAVKTTWVYKAVNNKPIEIRDGPSVDSGKVGHRIQMCEAFEVSEERKGEGDIIFLMLSDGRGWTFDKKPGTGTMCMRKDDFDKLPEEEKVVPPPRVEGPPKDDGGPPPVSGFEEKKQCCAVQ